MRLSRKLVGTGAGLAVALYVMVNAGGGGFWGSPPNGTLGEQALRGLTPHERTMLADKKVTPGEYELAVKDTVLCLRTAGFTVADPVYSKDKTLDYLASYSPPERAGAGPDAPPPDTSKMDARLAACQHLSEGAAAVYLMQHATSWTTRPLPGLKEALARYEG